MSETRKSSDTDLTHFRGGLMCKNCGQLSVHHGQYGNCPTPAEHPSPSTPPAQTGEARPVQRCDGMPHYYCINPSCQWVAHFKPVERKCPKCRSIVWKEGATTLQHKSVPLCEAAHAPSSSAREYESAEDWYIRMGFCVTQRVFGLVEVLELANRYAAERQRRG